MVVPPPHPPQEESMNSLAGEKHYESESDMRARDRVVCRVADGSEVEIDVILPDSVFKATKIKPTSCTLSTKGGDSRRGILLLFD